MVAAKLRRVGLDVGAWQCMALLERAELWVRDPFLCITQNLKWVLSGTKY
jgi:hypothetical protein